jgi:hypothetical protein
MKPTYKVVKKKSRMSAVVNGNSKYALRYPKGEEVWALDGTLGIMTFKSLYKAEQFRGWWGSGIWNNERKLMIIRVKPLARGRSVIWVAKEPTSDCMDEYYKDDIDQFRIGEAPDDTMAYPGVLVLD